MTQVILFPKLEPGEALNTIEKIVDLLDARRKLLISRRTFLHRYDKLRALLSVTPEYQFIRAQAFARAAGKCEKCHKAEPTDLCHRKRVATHPRLALATSNVYAGCSKCHQADHPQFKLRTG